MCDENIDKFRCRADSFTLCKVCGSVVDTKKRKGSDTTDSDSHVSLVSDMSSSEKIDKMFFSEISPKGSPKINTFYIEENEMRLRIMSISSVNTDEEEKSFDSLYCDKVSEELSDSEIKKLDTDSDDGVHYCNNCGSFRETFITKMPPIVQKALKVNKLNESKGSYLKIVKDKNYKESKLKPKDP